MGVVVLSILLGNTLVAVSALRALLDLLGKCCPDLRSQLSRIGQAAIPKFEHPLCWTEGNHEAQLPPRCEDADFGCVLQGALVGLGHVSCVASKLGGAELARSLTNLMRDILTAPNAGASDFQVLLIFQRCVVEEFMVPVHLPVGGLRS